MPTMTSTAAIIAHGAPTARASVGQIAAAFWAWPDARPYPGSRLRAFTRASTQKGRGACTAHLTTPLTKSEPTRMASTRRPSAASTHQYRKGTKAEKNISSPKNDSARITPSSAGLSRWSASTQSNPGHDIASHPHQTSKMIRADQPSSVWFTLSM